MNRYLITTGSITYAIKGRDLLRRKGFNVRTDKITSGLGSAGCGYVIVMTGGNIHEAEYLLRQAGVKILEINEIQ